MSVAFKGWFVRQAKVLFCALVLSCVNLPAKAEDMMPATVTSTAEQGYGRIVITFPGLLNLPEHNVSTENGVVVVSFAGTVDADVRDVVRELAEYITVARRDPDGSALRFGLMRGVTVNVMEAGEKLFVDYLPPGWQGLPPGLPANVVADLAGRAEAAALRAAEEERRRLLGELDAEVALRIGSHPTFTRLSFDWNIPFATNVSREGKKIRVRFNHRVGIDLSQLAANLPPLVEKVDAMLGDTGLEIIVDVSEEASIRAFEDGMSYIIDVSGPRGAPADPRLAALQEQMGTRTPDGAITTIGTRSYDTQMPSANAEAVASETHPVESPLVVAPHASGPAARPDAAPTLSRERPDLAGAVGNPGRGRAPEVMPANNEPRGAHMVRVETMRIGDVIRINFPFTSATPAAVFTRARSLYIVFDTIVPLDLRSIRNEAAHLIRDLSVVRDQNMTLIRMEMIDALFATASPEGLRWSITLGETVLTPTTPLDITRGTHADGRAYAEIEAQGIGRTFTMTDPTVGDRITAVTMLGPARGFLKPYNLVEFSTLPSAQGIAIIPQTDDLNVTVKEGSIIFDRPEGLRLSEIGASVDEFFFTGGQRPGYIDITTLRDTSSGDYYEKRDMLERALSVAQGDVKIQRLLDLARLHIAYQLGNEAIGLLDVALEEQPSLEHDQSFLVIRGAANVVAERTDDALSILTSSTLRNNVDATMWELIASAQKGNWRRVRTLAPRVEEIIEDYPAQVSNAVRLAIAEAALDANAISDIPNILGSINPSRLSTDQRAHHIILSALFEDALGRNEAALAMLQEAASMDTGPENARAELERIRILVREERMPNDVAAEQLERLTTGWRGDNTEIAARALLAHIYQQAGNFREAFHALKQAVMADSNSEVVRGLHNEMSATFTRLFLDGEADAMPTLDALSLFYDYRELTPIGRQGDEIVRRLADRLVEVDLLDQAAQLLQHQVDNRLTGIAKAQVAADLAVIYLMDSRPNDALRTLQQTRLSQLPEPIEHQRRIVEARALTDLGRGELALELLRPLSGSDVERLKAEALSNANRWQDAAETLERMLADRWRDPVDLAEVERMDVLRSAIAYSLAGDNIGLDRLRRKFSAKMSGSPHARAFDVVSAPIEARGIEFREVARQLAAVDTMRQFLEDYRTQYDGPPVTETPGS